MHFSIFIWHFLLFIWHFPNSIWHFSTFIPHFPSFIRQNTKSLLNGSSSHSELPVSVAGASPGHSQLYRQIFIYELTTNAILFSSTHSKLHQIYKSERSDLKLHQKSSTQGSRIPEIELFKSPFNRTRRNSFNDFIAEENECYDDRQYADDQCCADCAPVCHVLADEVLDSDSQRFVFL